MKLVSEMIKDGELNIEDLKNATWDSTGFTWGQMDISWDGVLIEDNK